jgi:hypothetical protein
MKGEVDDMVTLKAWCRWKREKIIEDPTTDAEAELAAVKVVEDLISQVGTWKARAEINGRKAFEWQEKADQARMDLESLRTKIASMNDIEEPQGFGDIVDQVFALVDVHYPETNLNRELIRIVLKATTDVIAEPSSPEVPLAIEILALHGIERRKAVDFQRPNG